MRKEVLLVVVIAVFAVYSLVEPYLLRVNDFVVSDVDVPEGFVGKKIAFISDVHCGSLFSPERLKNVVSLTNSLEPDLIVLGGDYVFLAGEDMEECMRSLGGLNAPLGVYAVFGNHDAWENIPFMRKICEEYGIKFIDNDALWIDSGPDRIRLGGVGDMWTNTQNISPTLKPVEDEDFVVLVSHNPQYADELDTSLVDLMLSGHTHGGQVLPVRLMAPHMSGWLRQTYMSGVYELDTLKLIVSNGVGMVFLPIRFMSPPEVVLVELADT
ncbi:MAG: metallophosphoesterase [Candidatus Altiarchaeota archaeon]